MLSYDTIIYQVGRNLLSDNTKDKNYQIVLRVNELAQKHGVSMTQIALAWQWAKGVMAPIVGTTKPSHFDDAVAALNLKLTPAEVAYLEELYQPHKIKGALKQNPPAGTVLVDKK